MEASVEQQRAAVRKQTGSDGFFVLSGFFLPPPRPLGASVLAAADTGCAALPEAELTARAHEETQAGLQAESSRAVESETLPGRPCAESGAGPTGLMQAAAAVRNAAPVPAASQPVQKPARPGR